MIIIANIRRQRHSMSDTRADVFHISYVTGTAKFRITKMTTRSLAAIFVKAPTWKAFCVVFTVATL